MSEDHTWHLHSVHVGLLHKVNHDQMICHLCGCHVFSLPPAFYDIGWLSLLNTNTKTIDLWGHGR